MSSTVTPNFRLAKPPFDTIPWDQAINGNMDIIDSTMAKYLTIPNFIGLWKNATTYTVTQVVMDSLDGSLWQCLVAHTSPIAPTTFSQARVLAPAQWGAGSSVITLPTTPPDNAFRNKLHNSLISVQQQSPDPANPGGSATLHNQFITDRWRLNTSLDTVISNPDPISLADRTAIGDEVATSGIAIAVTGNAGAGAYSAVIQNIDDVRRLGNMTVTVSFWAWHLFSGTRNVGVALLQNFGSGGSTDVQIIGSSILITTTPTRYSVTLTLPSTIGKTIGANSHTRLQLFVSSGSSLDAINGHVGVQNGSFVFWGLQLEPGDKMTTLEKVDPAYDQANCRRFYQQGIIRQYGYTGAGVVTRHSMPLVPPMRVAPAFFQFTGATITNLNTFTIEGDTLNVNMGGTAAATGAYVINLTFQADASL